MPTFSHPKLQEESEACQAKQQCPLHKLAYSIHATSKILQISLIVEF